VKTDLAEGSYKLPVDNLRRIVRHDSPIVQKNIAF
jgi:hypothetical protein